MQVAKWGNSLAIRLPKAVVDALNLKEGDHIEVVVHEKRQLGIAPDKRREAALEGVRKMQVTLPEGFRFDRDEANERR